MKTWVALLLLVPAIARADAVPGARNQCPDGARAESYHWGEACEPLNCRSDIDCDKNMRCVEVPLCIETGTRDTGSGTSVTGTCGASDPACPSPATCSTSSKRCVNDGLVHRYRRACGCGVLGEGADVSWALVLVVALLVRACRRAARSAGFPRSGRASEL
jgi:hypothetical protein